MKDPRQVSDLNGGTVERGLRGDPSVVKVDGTSRILVEGRQVDLESESKTPGQEGVPDPTLVVPDLE